jgi:hypothetical protein
MSRVEKEKSEIAFLFLKNLGKAYFVSSTAFPSAKAGRKLRSE